MELSDVLVSDWLLTREHTRVVRSDESAMKNELNKLCPPRCRNLREGVAALACRFSAAQSAGVSIFAAPKDDELTWMNVMGQLAHLKGQKFCKFHSMCGVVMETGQSQLFRHPHLYFQWMGHAGAEVAEALVVPLLYDDLMYGTIWVLHHQGGKQFTADDHGILAALADAASNRLFDFEG